jgi:hypothetical protein
MAADNTQRSIAAAIALFMGLIVAILVLAVRKIITFELAMLMLIALFGMYVGFGFLVAVYRFVARLK